MSSQVVEAKTGSSPLPSGNCPESLSRRLPNGAADCPHGFPGHLACFCAPLASISSKAAVSSIKSRKTLAWTTETTVQHIKQMLFRVFSKQCPVQTADERPLSHRP